MVVPAVVVVAVAAAEAAEEEAAVVVATDLTAHLGGTAFTLTSSRTTWWLASRPPTHVGPPSLGVAANPQTG